MKLIFFLQINIKGFFKLILSFQGCVARHNQITQNNKFAISQQYLQKEVSDEVDFCMHKKKLYGPFLWMGFNCLKARATLRRQFTFYH